MDKKIIEFGKEEWDKLSKEERASKTEGKLLLSVSTYLVSNGLIKVEIEASAFDGFTNSVFVEEEIGSFRVRKVSENGVYEEAEYCTRDEFIGYAETVEEARELIQKVIREVAANREIVRNKKFEKIDKVFLV